MNELLKIALIILAILSIFGLVVNTVYIQENFTFNDYKISKIGKEKDLFPKKIKALTPNILVKKGEKISNIQDDDSKTSLWQNRKYIGMN